MPLRLIGSSPMEMMTMTEIGIDSCNLFFGMKNSNKVEVLNVHSVIKSTSPIMSSSRRR